MNLKTTHDFLIAEFQRPSIPSEEICQRLFGVTTASLKRNRRFIQKTDTFAGQFRLGQVSLVELAKFIEKSRSRSRRTK